MIAFVIEAREVEHTMKHENADFLEQRVLVLRCLMGGALDGNGDFAEGRRRRFATVRATMIRTTVRATISREGEHVGRVIAVQKLAIQAEQFAIICKQAGEWPASGDFRGECPRELLKAALIGS